MEIDNYYQIFLDFDGVICDSNNIKKKNIFSATRKYTNSTVAKDFAKFFIRNSGIPREQKIFNYFNDTRLSELILTEYNKLNESLIMAPIMPGLKEFLEARINKEIYILSGGNKEEILKYLKKNEILHYIKEILSGPLTKIENLIKIKIYYPALFIADSEYDYFVARKFNLDFILMTQWSVLEEIGETFSNVKKTINFITLLRGEISEKN